MTAPRNRCEQALATWPSHGPLLAIMLSDFASCLHHPKQRDITRIARGNGPLTTSNRIPRRRCSRNSASRMCRRTGSTSPTWHTQARHRESDICTCHTPPRNLDTREITMSRHHTSIASSTNTTGGMTTQTGIDSLPGNLHDTNFRNNELRQWRIGTKQLTMTSPRRTLTNCESSTAALVPRFVPHSFARSSRGASANIHAMKLARGSNAFTIILVVSLAVCPASDSIQGGSFREMN